MEKKHAYILERKKTDCKMYGYLPWYYYFVTIIINIIINLNILDIDVFSPTVNIYCIIINVIITQKKQQQKTVILYYADSLHQ